MENITVLDQNTIDKIAAGEVIERPASVVKELVENSIDAGATAITVEIKEGGISFIRITDNGMGINKVEVPTAFLRHATSKIRSVEDLMNVSSLGFRGEALSSIAAVSQVELITKTAGGLTGIRYLIEGGNEKALEEIGAPEGTTFLVRNLFYNTPVRKKFLKSQVTEAGYINDLLERLALSHPDISFKFINNNQTKLHTSGNTRLKDIIYGIYGRDIANQLIEIQTSSDDVAMKGFIGKPSISRGNRNYENYYINGRYIKSKLITKAIEDAYKTFIMQHKYPFTVLHFSITSNLLDVNVHPTKMELRFSNQEQMYQIIFEAVKQALAQKELIPEVSFDRNRKIEKPKIPDNQVKIPEPFEKHRMEKELGVTPRDFAKSNLPSEASDRGSNDIGNNKQSNLDANNKKSNHPLSDIIPPAIGYTLDTQTEAKQAGFKNSMVDVDYTMITKEPVNKEKNHTVTEPVIEPAADRIAETTQYGGRQIDLFDGKMLSSAARDKHRIIGQLFETYWLVQFKDNLYIIDQHAAHEKVLYERTLKGLKSKEYTSQYLSPPIILTLTMQEETLLGKYMDNFTNIGFIIEPFGGKEYSVRAVPDNLFGIAQKDLLIEMLDSLSENMGTMNSNIVDEKIASMSCKAAVKGNNKLSFMEAQTLIDELLELDNPYNCPHGRPTIISMTKYELEKKFKRIL